MRNDKDGAPRVAHGAVQCLLNSCFALGIQRTGGLRNSRVMVLPR